jgi:hypothetical protein
MVLGALGAAARRVMEGRMRRDANAPNPYYSDVARNAWAKGAAEGRAEGEARAVLEVLAARGVAIDDTFAARVRGCTDLVQLSAWLARAATATALGDVSDG